MVHRGGDKTEKITINLGLVDIGQIDLLVREGFYTNRTDFIRTAIRAQLASQAEAVGQTAARRTLTLGSCHYTRRDLEQIRDTGQMIHIRVLGLASIAADVSPVGPGHDCLGGGASALSAHPMPSRPPWPLAPPEPRDHDGCLTVGTSRMRSVLSAGRKGMDEKRIRSWMHRQMTAMAEAHPLRPAKAAWSRQQR
jgi:Arc/MetJ-type ribon-helix-helix transcriptional regulator